MNNYRVEKSIILAAGYGTRLKPMTDIKPKCLIEYKGKPLIAHVIIKLIQSGVKEIVINTHHLHRQVETYFDENDFGIKINLVYEKDILGTGGAIKNAERYLADAENFFVYNADVISDINLTDLASSHVKSESLATLAVMNRKTKRPLLIDEYLIIRGKVSHGKSLISSSEKVNLKPYAFCGIHILNKRIFSLFPAEKVFDVIDFYIHISKLYTIKAFLAEHCQWKDMGTKESFYE